MTHNPLVTTGQWVMMGQDGSMGHDGLTGHTIRTQLIAYLESISMNYPGYSHR